MTINIKPVQNMGYESYLTKDYQAGTDTTITVYDAGNLPAAPNSIVISSLNNEDQVIVKYNAVSGNVLTVDTISHYNRPGAETTKYPRGCIAYKEFSDTVSGGGGSGGTDDYNQLSNKPQINGVQLQSNKSADDLGLVKSNWGVSEAGKVLKIADDGKVTAVAGGTTSVSFADITGQPTDNTNLSTALSGKVNKSTTSAHDVYIGVDSDGNSYIEY